MNNLTKILSKTEKKNSKIIEVKDKSTKSLVKTLSEIEIKIMTGTGNNEIVKLSVVNDKIVKLQSKDNGTPVVYDFTKVFDILNLDLFIKYLTNEYNLELTKYEV